MPRLRWTSAVTDTSAPSLSQLLAWLNRRYRMGVASIAVIVAAIVLLAFFDVQASRSLDRASATLVTADRAQVLTLDRQLAIRGFLLSGDSSFLTPGLAARAPLRAAVDSLVFLTRDDPSQHAAARALSSSIARWDSAYADRVLANDSLRGPRRAVLDQLTRGRLLYAPVRTGFATIIAHQHRRQASEATVERALRGMALAVAIVAVISLAFLFRYFRDNLHRQGEHLVDQQAKLKEQSRELEQYVDVLQSQAAELEITIEQLRETERELDRRTTAAEASERRVREVLESIPAGFFAADRDLRFTYVNPQYEAMAGRDCAQLLGSPLASMYSEFAGSHFEQRCRDVLQSGRASTFIEWEPATGQWLELHAYRTASGGLSVYLRDVTEQRALEAQFQQAQKMEAVGQLAGGIAHDFNNLLTVISSFTQFALESTPSNSSVRDDLGQVLAATERATSMTRQLLTLSRRQVLQPRVLDLNCVIDELMPMLRRLIPANIRIVRDAAPDPGTVWADEHQIGQVLLNLALNARDAMPHGGTLVIETSNMELDGSRMGGQRVAALASHVMIAVTDTGIGMDATTRERLFEPFFTTKPVGRGTGLGLSTVQRIVHQSGGSIQVSSEPGEAHRSTYTCLAIWVNRRP